MLSSKVSRADLPLAAAWVFLKRLLYAALLVALVALAAALAAAAVPRAFGYGILAVHGGSMSEAVPNGSLVFARWAAAEDVEVGDVILVQEESDDGPARPKVHRVVSLDEENGRILARTKGDANATPDPKLYILPDRVLMPARTVPYLGYVVGFAMTPLGWVSLVLLPATVLAVSLLRAIWAGDETVERRRAGRSGHGPILPPTLTMLLCCALVMGAVSMTVALGLFIDTGSVSANTFTTAATFP